MPPKKYQAPRFAAANAAPKKRGKTEKERPEGMTNAEWAIDVKWRQVENASRRTRELKARQRKASEAQAAEAAIALKAAIMAGMAAMPPQVGQYIPPGAWGSQVTWGYHGKVPS